MSIRTPGVERYLQRGDPELLFRHYMLSKDYPKVPAVQCAMCAVCVSHLYLGFV